VGDRIFAYEFEGSSQPPAVTNVGEAIIKTHIVNDSILRAKPRGATREDKLHWSTCLVFKCATITIAVVRLRNAIVGAHKHDRVTVRSEWRPCEAEDRLRTSPKRFLGAHPPPRLDPCVMNLVEDHESSMARIRRVSQEHVCGGEQALVGSNGTDPAIADGLYRLPVAWTAKRQRGGRTIRLGGATQPAVSDPEAWHKDQDPADHPFGQKPIGNLKPKVRLSSSWTCLHEHWLALDAI
jgi:hypothetical protein